MTQMNIAFTGMHAASGQCNALVLCHGLDAGSITLGVILTIGTTPLEGQYSRICYSGLKKPIICLPIYTPFHLSFWR